MKQIDDRPRKTARSEPARGGLAGDAEQTLRRP
jgi:hypothetical protein